MKVYSVLLLIALSCCCAEEPPDPPSIRLNSDFLSNQTEVILTAGSAFTLRCNGKSSVRWSSTAFSLMYQESLPNPVEVKRSDPRHTGTYHCGYTDRSLQHLHIWIHLYVKDWDNPANVFVTPRTIPSPKEGEDFLFKCLLTDPSVTNVTLQSEGSDGGRGLPQGMNVTFDPHRGALIRDLQKSFKGNYVCSGWKDGRQFRSRSLHLVVVPRLREPPLLSVSQEGFVRLVGEKFEVTCLSSNPSHLYNISWTHPNTKTLNVTESHRYGNSRLYRNLTVTVSAVSLTHSGTYTCTAHNEAGVSTATAQLRLLDRPYLRIYLQRRQHADDNKKTIEVNGDQDANTSSMLMEVQGMLEASISGNSLDTYRELIANISTDRVDVNGVSNISGSSTMEVYEGQDVMLTFVMELYPPIRNQHWTTPSNVSINDNNMVYQESYTTNGYRSEASLLLWRVHQEDQGQYSFHFSNSFFSGSQSIDLQIFREPPAFFTPVLTAAVSAAAIFLLLSLVVLYKWRQKPKYEIRWKIIESTDGNNYTFVDPTQLPYNYKWEFPRDKLRLGAVLGSGAFGKVVEATAYGLGTNNDVTRVAVKMLKPSAHSEEREALMSELKILSHLGYHDNIVNLLGACTQGGPMLMITEYCSHGDLLNFLRSHTQDFMASILSVDEVEGEAFYKNMAAQHGRLRSDSGISCCSDYQEMQPVLSPGQTHQGVQTDNLSVGDLMRFSHQVAQGLDFLSTRNCIHRDVAARNVLLTDHRVAKICDFGLARDIRNDDSYIVQGNARLPVKWMAPESIFQCVYTVQSDVWSYGVLLWEIFSLGKSPYPNIAVDTNFYKMIKDGRHMTRPDFAPAEMYELMTLCWSLEPTDRPNFKMIGHLINRLLPSTNDKSPHHSEQSYRNIYECREEEEEEEEEEEVREGETLKTGVEEHSQRECHDDDEEEEPVTKNIYQLS